MWRSRLSWELSSSSCAIKRAFTLMNKRHTVLTPYAPVVGAIMRLRMGTPSTASRDRDGGASRGSVLCYNHDAPPFVLAFCDRGANPDALHPDGFTPMILAGEVLEVVVLALLLWPRRPDATTTPASIASACVTPPRHSAYATRPAQRDVGATSSPTGRTSMFLLPGGTTALVDVRRQSRRRRRARELASGGVCCAVLPPGMGVRGCHTWCTLT